MLGDIDAEPVVVYGVADVSYEEMLDTKWLKKNFKDISVFFCGVSDGGYGTPIYGYELTLDKTTGVLSEVSEKMKERIAKLHYILLKYHQSETESSKVEEWENNLRFVKMSPVKPPENDNLPEIGYYTAVSDVNGRIDDKYIPEIY